MTDELCVNYCDNQGFSHAGTENGTDCCECHVSTLPAGRPSSFVTWFRLLTRFLDARLRKRGASQHIIR
jgi:hypothetical protein